jgi:hypothetical protein
VVDGAAREPATRAAVRGVSTGPKSPRVIVLPEATGEQDWCGHRIYGAASFLVNTEFVCFLDEDNWFDPEHVGSLVAAARAGRGHWAFSLRNIVDVDGALVAPDLCESLGSLHPVFSHASATHIDTNCYLLSRPLAVRTAHKWYLQTSAGDRIAKPDQAMCQALLARVPPACTNRRHTVNYTVGSRPGSVAVDFFLRGNAAMRERYPEGLPWERA